MTSLDILTHLLLQPAGSFAYHLVVLFAIGGALQAAWLQWQRSAYPQTRRLLIGLLLLLGVQTGYLIAGGVVWGHVLTAHAVLPLADRTASAFALLLFTWLWGFPEQHRGGDRFLAAGIAAITLAAIASLAAWPYFSLRYFNNSVLDLAWSGLNILLGVIGLLILTQRRPDAAGSGQLAVGLLTLGYLVHVFLPPAGGDLDGYLRLAGLAAYPFLFALPYRFAETPKTPRKPIRLQQAAAPPPNVAAQEALLELLSTSPEAPEACPRMAKTVALLMKADLCLVIAPPQHGRLSIACAYDLIREQALSGITFSAEKAPILVAAMKRRRALRLPTSSTSADARTLAHLLNLARSGPMLAVPLTADEHAPVHGALLLLSTYAQQSWTAASEQRLTAIARRLSRWLDRQSAAPSPAEPAAPAPPEEPESGSRVAILEEQILNLSEENAALRTQLSHVSDLEKRLQMLAAAHDETQQLVETLEAENRHLHAALEASADHGRNAHEQQQNLEMLLSSAQDLRQPLASLIGYADLLLGESVGILGALQRQFVERIRSSASRMAHAVDDMVQTLVLEEGNLQIHPQEIDLNEAIDDAMSRNSSLLQEKRLMLRVDLPDNLPQAQLDREMLHQILHHLLRNAALASPEEGEILLRLQVMEEEEPIVLIEVRDSGDGIAAEDIPRVFSRRYRTTYRTIAGLGDNGLGMPLVAALVKALDGRVWVESVPGAGTTFSVILPLHAAAAENGKAAATANKP